MKRFRDHRMLISVALAALLSGATSQAQTGQSGSPFTGCDDGAVITDSKGTPRERIDAAAGRTDPVTERVFKSFSIEEVGDVTAPEFSAMCWSRLDGIWSQQMRISHDKSVRPEGWAAESPSLLEFAHGNYTTPMQIAVDASASFDTAITLRSAVGPGPAVRFTSSDGVSVISVLSESAAFKTYASPPINGIAETLRLDVTRTGNIRLRLGDRIFLRPRPDISKAAMEGQVGSNDIFAIAYNPKNLRANRQGYDVTTQNPDRFLDNGGKLDIFAPAEPRAYYISEQLTVPLGLKLIEEGSQGTVFYERLLSSEFEMQEASRTSFGVNAGISNEKSVKSGEAAGGGSAPRKLGGSIGYSSVKEQMQGLRESRSVSSIDGFQRYKKYALVRDHPFSKLSDAFIDAVEDASQSGDYSRIISSFGTHYAYAVTYGAAGHISTRISEESLSANYNAFEQSGASGGLTLGPVEFSATKESSKDLKQGNTVSSRFGKTTFTAVGGNGSWSEAGFVAGDAPYPILMDLRPLDELLNPVNFPGEPKIYEDARERLGAAIANYLEGKAQLVSKASLLDGFTLPERWELRFTRLQCNNAGGWEDDRIVETTGKLTVSVKSNPGKVSAKSMTILNGALNVSCKPGSRTRDAAQTVSGTRQELAGLRFAVTANMLELDYAGFVDPDDDMKGSSPPIAVPDSLNVPVGATKNGEWRIPHSDNADVRLMWTWKRLQ